MDENFRVTGLLGGPIDPDKRDRALIPSNGGMTALVFVGAALLLGALLLLEKKLRKGKSKKA